MSNRSQKLLANVGERAFLLLQRSYQNKTVEQAERSGERLGLVAYMLDKKHRIRTFANLQMAFPDWSETRVKTIGKNVFRHFGRVTGDFLRSPARSNEEVLASIELEGGEFFEEAEQQGLGCIFVTAHFGNWERYGQYVAATGRKLSVVARDANQAGIQDRVLAIRESTGVEVLSRGSAVREMLRRLKRRELVAVLSDQNSDECFVPFFGKPCGCVMGPAVMHQRSGAPLITSFLARIGPGKYRGIVFPMIDPSNTETDGVKLISALSERLEEVVREYPEQWLWMHDRWKSARQRGLL